MELTDEIKRKIFESIDEIVSKHYYHNDDGRIELCLDRGDCLTKDDLDFIFSKREGIHDRYYSIISRIIDDMTAHDYNEGGLFNDIEKLQYDLLSVGINEQQFDCNDAFWSKYYFDLPEWFLNPDIYASVYIDCGDMSRYSNESSCPEKIIEGHDTTSIVWLCKQQGVYDDVVEMIEDGYENYHLLKNRDACVTSIVNEIMNFVGEYSCLVICGNAKLFTVMEIQQKLNDIERSCNKNIESNYNGDTRKHIISSYKGNDVVVVSGSNVIGLFDDINGGGATLEIKPKKDIEIPISIIDRIQPYNAGIGYSIDEVYGISNPKGTLIFKQ